MAAHERKPQYIIRIPENLWYRLIQHDYIAEHGSLKTFRIFAAAARGRNGGGHSRYIKGDHRSLNRILELLKQLIERIRNHEYTCQDFRTTLVDLDRFAHQAPMEADTVKITIADDKQRTLRRITGADLPEIR